MKIHLNNYLKKSLLFVLLAFTLIWGDIAVVSATNGEPIEPVKQISTSPSNDDATWPIVRTERIEDFDNETGTRYVSVLVVRQSQANPSSDAETACLETSYLASCVKVDAASFTLTGTISNGGGWIRSHVKSYSDVMCNGSDCVYRKPTKIEAWWTRSGSTWTASGAFAGWGCYGCAVCGGGTWQTVWIESPAFTPAWQNSTQSYYYTYTSTSYPGLYPWDSIADRASMDSKAYQSGTFRGNLSVNPGFS